MNTSEIRKAFEENERMKDANLDRQGNGYANPMVNQMWIGWNAACVEVNRLKHTRAPFHSRIMSHLVAISDRVGTEHEGPLEDDEGPMQDDADASLRTAEIVKQCASARKTLPQIVGVAIIYAGKTYSLPKPKRHHDVIRSIPGGVKGPDTQGFILDDGSFLGRTGAMQLARDNGQLKRSSNPNHYQGNKLFSEDLW